MNWQNTKHHNSGRTRNFFGSKKNLFSITIELKSFDSEAYKFIFFGWTCAGLCTAKIGRKIYLGDSLGHSGEDKTSTEEAGIGLVVDWLLLESVSFANFRECSLMDYRKNRFSFFELPDALAAQPAEAFEWMYVSSSCGWEGETKKKTEN